MQVRRPRAGKHGRRAFVSAKKKQNTEKATVATDGKGRTLWAGAFRPGRMHDQTALRTEGIADLFEPVPPGKEQSRRRIPGLAKEFPDQVQAPPLKPKKNATTEEVAAYEEQRHRQSSERICVEHANAEHKQWRPSSGTSDDAKTSKRPSWRSPGWSPTALLHGNPSQPARPARPPLIAHQGVSFHYLAPYQYCCTARAGRPDTGRVLKDRE